MQCMTYGTQTDKQRTSKSLMNLAIMIIKLSLIY